MKSVIAYYNVITGFFISCAVGGNIEGEPPTVTFENAPTSKVVTVKDAPSRVAVEDAPTRSRC